MRISDWSSDVCSSDLHGANTGITHRRGDITLLELAKQHVDDDAVGAETLVRHATQFFMRTVHRVAGLERDDLVPAARLDFVADFDGGAEGIREISFEIAVVQHVDRARQHSVAQSRSEEHTSELQSLIRISYAVFCL